MLLRDTKEDWSEWKGTKFLERKKKIINVISSSEPLISYWKPPKSTKRQLFFLSFCLFWGRSCGMWTFPGWGSGRSRGHPAAPEPQRRRIGATSATSSNARFLDPLGRSRDWARNLMVPGQVHWPLCHYGNSKENFLYISKFISKFIEGKTNINC